MSWFGFGGGGDDDKKSSSSSSSSSAYDTTFPGDSQHDQGFSASSMGGGGVGGDAGGIPSMRGASQHDMQLAQLAQAAVNQAVVYKMVEIAFDKCVQKPGSSLSSSERSCIRAQTGKFIDASNFIAQGLQGN